MKCAMCGRKSKIIAKHEIFEYSGSVWSVDKLMWYDDIKGTLKRLNLCYKCAEELAEIAKAKRQSYE
jgi:hypothetical protein